MSKISHRQWPFDHEGKHYEVRSLADPRGVALAIFHDGQMITTPRLADGDVSSDADPASVEVMMNFMVRMFMEGALERLPRSPSSEP